MSAVHLRRIDDARNMRRFYRLDVQPDLFGGVLLVKQWGRIGAQGRMVDESYATEELAADAMWAHAERKRRRRYVASKASPRPTFSLETREDAAHARRSEN